MKWALKIVRPCAVHQYVLHSAASLVVHDREAQDGTARSAAGSPAVCGTNQSAILEIPVRPDHDVHLL
jgi:hypothetical protein